MHKISFKNSTMTLLQKDKDLLSIEKKCILRCKKDLKEDMLPFITLEYAKNIEEEIMLFLPFFENKKNLIVIGIGGSALGTKAIKESFSLREDIYSNEKMLYILDNLDEEYIEYIIKKVEPSTTAVLVISKSGDTIESICQYHVFKEWLQKHLETEWKNHCAMVTQEKGGFLREEAEKENLLCATIDKNLGGRYSVISAVSILPAIFLNLNWKAMVQGAKDYAVSFLRALENGSLSDFPSYILALWQYLSEEDGKTESIVFSYIPRFSSWSAWYAQLIAESLGKNGKGLMPISSQGVTDQHSLQQMFLDGKKNKICIFITEAKKNGRIYIPKNLTEPWSCVAGKSIQDVLFAEYIGTCSAFMEANIPFVEYEIPEITEYNVGKMIILFEIATILMGYALDINPLNQPAVEYGKKITLSLLKDGKYTLSNKSEVIKNGDILF